MSFVQVPPDSTGKKVYTKTATVGADTVQTQVVHLVDEANPNNLLEIDRRGSASVRFAEGQPVMSAFGNLKTSTERVVGVYESSLDTYEALFSTVVTNGGEKVYNTAESSEVYRVSGVSGSRIWTSTNRYHYYLPGSSNLIKMTVACGDAGKVGNRRMWGAFDANDGVFFDLNGTEVGVVLRSSTTGVVTETRIPQSQWNYDKLDGTGISDYVLDITKINVWWIDYQWLGAGRVRFGVFEPSGARIVCHQIENAGQNSLPYMRTGTLPIRIENINTSATGSSSEIRAVCLSVYTEGTHEDYAFWRYADVDRIGTVVTTDTSVLSMRAVTQINGEHNSVIIYPETLNVYTDQPVAITIWQDATTTGGTWEALYSAGEVNYTGSISPVGAQKFKTFYVSPGATMIDLDKFFEKNDEGIQANADGTAEVWALTATRLTSNTTTISVNLGYKELW